MLIDWFTVVAQAINFLILVWLLKRFLYQPILDAIDAREQRIAQTLAEADAKKAAARLERDEFERKNRELDEQRQSMVSRMQDEVSGLRQKLLDDAQSAAERLQAKWHVSLQRQQQRLGEGLSRRVQDEVFSITRKTLLDLADDDLEASIINVFIGRLRQLDGEALANFVQALTAAEESVRIRSAFELTDEQQTAIRQVLSEIFPADAAVRFDCEPDLIAGIELTVGGRRVAWSIEDYLKTLKDSLGDLVREQESSPGTPTAESESLA